MSLPTAPTTDEPEPTLDATTPENGTPPGLTMGYQPALDGLRGLAVLAIVVFHAGGAWAPGAFLSVSTFFTLSGFLITSLLLAEQSRSGRISLAAFYGRRARRLLPAALVAVALILVATLVLGDAAQLAGLRGDALASLGYVANWWFVVVGESYGDIFASPSPFTHFWTLGIEEQFYLLYPVTMAGALRLGRGSRRVVAGVLGALLAGSVLLANVLLSRGASLDRVYFGTDTRLAELLAGALLATAWPARHRLPAAATRWIRAVGAIALVAMLALWATAQQDQEVWYRGGLMAYSLLTLAVILAAVEPAGPIRTALGWRPIVWVGTISYGAYLVHWPVLVWLQARTPLPAEGRLAVGLAVTLVLAALSYRVLEGPIRERRRLTGPRAALVAPVSFALVAAAILGATAVRTPDTELIDFESSARQLDLLGAGATPTDPAELAAARELAIAKLTPEERERFGEWMAKETAVRDATSPRVAMFGDSTALMTGFGLSTWQIDHLDVSAPAHGETQLGCGLLTGVTHITGGQEKPVSPECDGWLDRWATTAGASRIDIAVVQLGPWDVLDQRLTDDGPFLRLDRDPALAEALAARLDAGVRTLLEHVGYVVVVAPPDVEFGRVDGRSPPRTLPESDPARMARFRTMVREVARRHDRVGVVDLAGWYATRSDDHRLRPDGIHTTESTALEVAEWLGPELDRLYRTRPPP